MSDPILPEAFGENIAMTDAPTIRLADFAGPRIGVDVQLLFAHRQLKREQINLFSRPTTSPGPDPRPAIMACIGCDGYGVNFGVRSGQIL